MKNVLVCHGAHFFSHTLPPFTLEEGGMVVVRTRLVSPQAQYAEILFCEALAGTVTIEGVDVLQSFELAHPHLRAEAYSRDVSSRIYLEHPPGAQGGIVKRMFRFTNNVYDVSSNIENCLHCFSNIVFSFRALEYESRCRVRDLLMARPPRVAAIGIEATTANFSIEQFLPGVRIVDLGPGRE